MHRIRTITLATIATLLHSPLLPAQHPDTPIFNQSAAGINAQRQEIIRKALAIRDQVPAIDKPEIDRQLLSPTPEKIELLPPLTVPLSPEDIASYAHKTNLRVGFCYLCNRCDDWHINLAGGYAIASNVIATCDHVMVNKTAMRDGFFVAADHQGNVALAVAVLARCARMDAAIIKVAGAGFNPVPLNSNVRQGASAYCFSYPLRQEGLFSAGIVNRFFWNDKYNGQDQDSLDGLAHLRVNFTTDWAPGSSGSAIYDAAGNAIGHVSTIAGLSQGNRRPPLLTLRTGTPALAVKRLAESLDKPEEIQRIASISAPEGKPEASDEPDAASD
jgi:hypothetical protein